VGQCNVLFRPGGGTGRTRRRCGLDVFPSTVDAFMVWQDIPHLVLTSKRLGKGTYSTVILGYDCRAGRDGVPVAVKVFDFKDKKVNAARILLGIIENELSIHQAVDSPYICRPMGHGTCRLISNPRLRARR
jgi:hypothetical protein